ncbi:MAG TPA: nucleoid occlusion protein [Bacillota bacterium]|nr:nucleoid occlusion protein [Bacillota bacterium]HPZ22752.1 nucleoid occlusion protein [Bacillota bacterium]
MIILGDGVSKLFFGTEASSLEETKELSCSKISPNPFQPRQHFDEENLEELAQSIRTYGLLQPIIVRPYEKGYQLVAGERRLRACKILGWSRIPAVIRDINDSAMAAIALIENLQREDLDFFEEAKGYQRLLDEFSLTQEVLAQRIGKSQSTIANKMRLLKLTESVQSKLLEAGLSERHARALLKLPDAKSQEQILEKVIRLNLNVRQTEDLIEDVLADNKDASSEAKGTQKFVIRDYRIVLNTIRQAITSMEQIGLRPQLTHHEHKEYFEITIRVPK